jgi:hypothetical protein
MGVVRLYGSGDWYMKNRLFILALVVAACVHAIAGLSLSVLLGTHTRNPSDAPRVAVTLELAETDVRDTKKVTGSRKAKIPATGQIAKETDQRLAAVSDKPPGERLTPGTGQTAEETSEESARIPRKSLGDGLTPANGQATIEGTNQESAPAGQPLLAGNEPPYLIDTPPKFIEKGPISFPKDIQNLTESTSIIVHLSLSARAEILSIDAIAKGVDELKVEVIKMILKSKFSPAYVGRIPVPCMAKCVVTIVCKQVD